MPDREITVKIKLSNYFSHLYDYYKPENFSDDDFICAMVQQWFFEHDIEKSKVEK